MGGSGGSGPTLQQQELQTEQAMTNANLNLEENDQRKTMLNAMQGTRVFRGSALSRAVRGNNNTGSSQGNGISKAQVTGYSAPPVVSASQSLLSQTQSGNTTANPAASNTAATRFGGGSSSLPSGANCFSGGTRVLTAEGFRRFDELPAIVEIINHTGRHTAELLVHEGSTEPMRVMGADLVTETHPIRVGDGWVDAKLIFAVEAPVEPRTVYNLHVLGSEQDAHYLLANGLTAHNKIMGT
jgi:hypothetical protein